MKRIIGVHISFPRDDRNELIRQRAAELGFEAHFYTDFPPAEELASCEVLFGMFRPADLRQAANLRWMQCSFAGVDLYTGKDVFPHDGVLFTNAAGAYGITISEHLICTLLMMMRRMPEYGALVAQQGWKILGDIRSIYGSKVLCVGMGDIGSCFGTRCRALGAEVSGVRRRPELGKPDWCDRVWPTSALREAVADADVVAVSVPGTHDARHLFGAEEFAAMKDGAYFLNVGRGTTVDQTALANALRSGKLAGAALDVADPEPLPKDHFLWSVPNLILTPHVSGNMSLEKTCELVLHIFLDNLTRYAAGEPLAHLVDLRAGY